jgi:hypothetical protein
MLPCLPPLLPTARPFTPNCRTAGVLSGEKQRVERAYDFIQVCSWFAARCDLILLLFDPAKLDISDEFKAVRCCSTGGAALLVWGVFVCALVWLTLQAAGSLADLPAAAPTASHPHSATLTHPHHSAGDQHAARS